MNSTIVEMENVSFAYNGQTVLQEVNLAIAPEDFVAIIGPNGGGKTTLLKLLLGLLTPDTGSIRVLGDSPGEASHHIGYVRQDVHINQRFPITALDVVLMGKLDPRRRWARHTTQDRRDALQALERMEMAPYAKRRIGELSGGQRQRVFIARALVTQPRLLLLDEPTEGIQPNIVAEIGSVVRRLNQDMGLTVLLVEQKLPFARKVADRFCLLDRGRAVASGTMSELNEELIQQYLTV